MAAITQLIRDNAQYYSGYLQGRSYGFPSNFSSLYGLLISKTTSFISLPLPLLSFLALPVFGGTSTSVTLLMFYMTWSSLVLTHDPLNVEIYGTLVVRLLCYLLPAFAFLFFDISVPSLSKGIKASGRKHLPGALNKERLARIAGVATGNTLLAVALQAILEVVATDVLHLRSILKVTTTVPLPWNLAKDILQGLALRGVLHYAAHRYILHTYDTPLKSWHLKWQHSVNLPFSLVAAYDHPACYLVGRWLPVYVPAYLFRFHVLTWHIFVAITSLEELFIYSGYAVLPSSIVLAGMARRTDAHFATASRKFAANFGNTGILDLICGTNAKKESSVLDDLQDEAAEHNIEARIQKAARGMIEGMKNDDADDDEDENDAEYVPEETSKENDGDVTAVAPKKSLFKRRSGRKTAQKS